ncbi:E3 ubiquitin-protein ligase RNF14-like, partial [Pollicipes pollicipes]|uniref:E3 ubiquitin-protein ligase RNF14-like n=1 Tax=Pollicipes pollicipes TaxID=41117 RepID=UPI0018851323
MTDKEAQEEEMLAMDSIYGHDSVFMVDQATMTGVISVPIEHQCDLEIKPPEVGKDVISVRYLPPICLEFCLPDDYPSKAPPAVRVVCNWLTPAQMLSIWRHLRLIWKQNNGCPVLYEFAEFLKSDVMSFLNVDRELDVTFFVERARVYAERHAAHVTTGDQASPPDELPDSPIELEPPDS